MEPLPATADLPPHTLDIEPITYEHIAPDPFSATGQSVQQATGGRINGADYSDMGMSQQQMVDRLAKYVTAHNGTLLGVQFDSADTSKGFFIVQDTTTLAATRYDFYINTRQDTVSVVGPMPWQL